MVPPTPRSTLFPYTTLFRSSVWPNTSTATTRSLVSRVIAASCAGEIAAQPYAITASAGAVSSARCIASRSEEHTSELQSHVNIVCRLLLEKKNIRGELHQLR